MIMRYSFKPCAPSSLFFGSWSLSAVRALVLSSWGKEQHRVWKFLLNSGAVTSSGNLSRRNLAFCGWNWLCVSSRTIECSGWSQELCLWEAASSGGACCHSSDDSWKLRCRLGYEGSDSAQYRSGAAVLCPGLSLSRALRPWTGFFNFSQPHPAFPLKSVSPASCG